MFKSKTRTVGEFLLKNDFQFLMTKSNEKKIFKKTDFELKSALLELTIS